MIASSLQQRSVTQPRVLTLSSQSHVETASVQPLVRNVASSEEENASQHQIFGNLQNLDVHIPEMTPTVSLPPTPIASTAQPLPTVSPLQAASIPHDHPAGDSDDELRLAPMTFTDFDDELDENELMSIKQYRVLNKKLNVLLQSMDDSLDKSSKREEAFDHQSAEVQQRITKMAKEIEELKAEVKSNHTSQSQVTEVLNEKVTTVIEKVSVLESSTVEDLRSQLLAGQAREEQLRKQLEESQLQTKQLHDRIPLFNPQDWSVAYNEGVVKHVSAVQSSLINHLQPIIQFVTRLPGFARHSVSAQQGEIEGNLLRKLKCLLFLLLYQS